ncbi:MAG: hypothetical protein LUH15_10345 [Tannerellaceae bacterium]|nr:hypothetical protein [Tannerellaceae bacterium]
MKYIITPILMTCSFTLLSGVIACSPEDTEPSTTLPGLQMLLEPEV